MSETVVNKENTSNGFLLLSHYRGAIMGMAAIMIFVFHAWLAVIPESSNSVISFFHDAEYFIRKVSFFGVDIFLLMSGMGLTYAIKKDTLPEFYYRRIRRVYLPYLVSLTASAFIYRWSFLTFLGHASCYTFYAEDVNAYCWFVPAIITLYVFFPLYNKAFGKAKNKLLFTALAILVWLLLTLLSDGRMRFDLFGFTNRIPVFLLGILFGHLAQSEKPIVFKAWHYLLLLVTLAAGLLLYYVYTFLDLKLILPDGRLFVSNILMSSGLSLLVAKLLDILERRVPMLGRIINKVLGIWGKMSLEMYLVYVCLLIPFFGKFVMALVDLGLKNHPLPVNLIVFAVSSAIAWTAALAFSYFWKLVELPFKRKKAEGK